MEFIVGLYAILLIIFLLFCAFIARHTEKYGFFSPRFKTITLIFGTMALALIIFSLYLLLQLYIVSPADLPAEAIKKAGGNLNF